MYFEEFAAGQVYRSECRKVTLEEILEFAERYDPQYMHLDEERAGESIFGGIIASGLHTLSVVWRLWVDTRTMGDEVVGGIGMEGIRFIRPVYPGDELTVSAEVKEVGPHRARSDMGRIVLALVATNQRDEKVLTVTALALLKRSPV